MGRCDRTPRWTMALAVTDEHRQLAEAVRSWAARHCPADVVRAAVTEPGGPGGPSGPAPGAPAADLLILPGTGPGGDTWVAVDASELEIAQLDSLDLTRPAGRVSADGLTVPAGRVHAGVSRETVSWLAAALLGAEAC